MSFAEARGRGDDQFPSEIARCRDTRPAGSNGNAWKPSFVLFIDSSLTRNSCRNNSVHQDDSHLNYFSRLETLRKPNPRDTSAVAESRYPGSRVERRFLNMLLGRGKKKHKRKTKKKDAEYTIRESRSGTSACRRERTLHFTSNTHN